MIDAGVRVIQMDNSRRGLFGLCFITTHLIKTFRKEKPDILHFFLPQAYMLGTICSLVVPSARRIMSRRSLNNYQFGHPILKYIEYYLHRYMDVILGNSIRVIKQLQEEGISHKNIGLIYNGIENTKLTVRYTQKEARENLKINDSALIFVVVANLIEYKGHDDLLVALGDITDSLPHDWVLICVGRDNGYGAELYERSIRLGIHNHIIWVGQSMDVSVYNAAANIGILPSHEEGFSNSLLECLVSGLPMVVTDVGGNSEAVVDGESGLVIPSKKPKKIAEALLTLVNDIDFRTRIGKEARQRVEQEFSIETCVEKYNCLYANTMKDIFDYNSQSVVLK